MQQIKETDPDWARTQTHLQLPQLAHQPLDCVENLIHIFDHMALVPNLQLARFFYFFFQLHSHQLVGLRSAG